MSKCMMLNDKHQASENKYTYFLHLINPDLWIENEEKLNTFTYGHNCLVCFKTDRVAQTTNIYLSQFWRLEVQDQLTSRIGAGRASLPGSYPAVFSLCPQMEEGARELALWGLLHKRLIPFMSVPPSWPNHPKGPMLWGVSQLIT